jgi:hypothetical protein
MITLYSVKVLVIRCGNETEISQRVWGLIQSSLNINNKRGFHATRFR